MKIDTLECVHLTESAKINMFTVCALIVKFLGFFLLSKVVKIQNYIRKYIEIFHSFRIVGKKNSTN